MKNILLITALILLNLSAYTQCSPVGTDAEIKIVATSIDQNTLGNEGVGKGSQRIYQGFFPGTSYSLALNNAPGNLSCRQAIFLNSSNGNLGSWFDISSTTTVTAPVNTAKLLVRTSRSNNTWTATSATLTYRLNSHTASATISGTATNETCSVTDDGTITNIAISGGLKTRYVSVYQNNYDWLNPREMRIYDIAGNNIANNNIALSKTVIRDGCWNGSALAVPASGCSEVASALIDDNNATKVHSGNSKGFYLTVDLGAEYTLDRVEIVGDNCCSVNRGNKLVMQLRNAANKVIYAEERNIHNQTQVFNVTDVTWSDGVGSLERFSLNAGTYTLNYSDVVGNSGTQPFIVGTDTYSAIQSDVKMNETCPGDNDGSINLTLKSNLNAAEPPAFSNLALWTKGDKGVIKNGNDKVVQWQDLSGNNNHFNLNYGINVEHPSSSINSLPAIRFNAGEIMESTTTLSNPYTLIVVGKLNGGANNRLVSSGSSNWLLGWWGGNRNAMYANGWVRTGITSNITDSYIYTVSRNTGNTSFWGNGSLLASNTSGTSAPGIISLGGWGTGNTELSNGDVAEVIAYNRELTTDERMAIEKYLSEKYSISGPTGTNHSVLWSPNGESTEDLSSLSAGNYSVTITDAKGCSEVKPFIVTSKLNSTVATSASASSSFLCSGDAVTLSVTGGSLGTGATWEWYTDAAFTTSVGSGTPLIINPTTTATYYVRAEGDCNNTTAVNTGAVIVNGSSTPPIMASLPSSNATSTCDINDAAWHHFYDSNGDLLASINSNGENLESVTVAIEVGNAGPFGAGLAPGVCGYPGVNNGELALARNWDITIGGSQPTIPVDVKFYYEATEVSDLTTAISGLAYSADYISCWGNVASESDLMMTVSHTGGGTELFPTLSPVAGPGTGIREVAFQLSEFSSGILHSNGGVGAGNALPVELLSFEARPINNEYIELNWTTATEINNDGFELLRSTDGISFEKIAWIAGNGNTNEQQTYNFNDTKVSNGLYYYKLKQIDFDGASEEFNVISAIIDAKFETVDVVVRPIPTSNTITIDVTAGTTSSVEVLVYNYSGQKVMEVNKKVTEGKNNLTIEEVSDLSSGIYYVNFTINDKVITKKFVVSK